MTRDQYLQSLIDKGLEEDQIAELLLKFDAKQKNAPVDLPGFREDFGLGKPTDPVNVEANAGSEDMASKSDPGSGELQQAGFKLPSSKGKNEDLTEEQKRFGEKTLVEEIFGDNPVTNFVGDMSRAFSGGRTQGASLDPALELYKANTTPEEIKAFLKAAREMENAPQTDEMIEFGKDYEARKQRMGGVKAFFSAWWDNPTAMAQFSAQSMGNMYESATTSEEAALLASGASAAGAGTGAALGLAGGIFAPVTSTAGAITGGISGGMAALSATMEVGFTTADLLQEVVNERLKGTDKQWANMTDDERFEITSELLADPEVKKDITNRALARGLTIGLIDGLTGIATGGVGGATRKAIASTGRQALARGGQVIAAATTETVGGLASEIGGQYAAGQEFDAREILTEGFADKTFTLVETAKATSGIKPGKVLLETAKKTISLPVYRINGEVVDTKKFREVVSNMDDATIMSSNIEITNDEVMSKIIENRIRDINIDQKIDPKISDVNDRAEIIQAERELQILKNNDTKSAANKRAELSNKISEITAKYEGADVDVNVQERQQAVAQAARTKIENEFNANYFNVVKAAEDVQGVNVKKFNTTAEVEAFLNEQQDVNLDDVKKSAGQQGFIIQRADGTQEIILNKEQAVKDQAVNVASHEFLHAVLFKTVKDTPQNAVNLGNALLQELNKLDVNKIQNSDFKKRMALYNDKSVDVQMEEALTLYSDAIATGDIKFEENTFTRIGDVIRRTMQRFGVNIKFNSGRDVYNFIKDYNKSVSEGGLNLAQRKLADRGAQGSLVQNQATQQESTVKESRSLYDEFSAEELVEIVKSPSTTAAQRSQAETALTNQFDLLALKAIKYDTRAGNIARENVVAEARAELPGIIERFNPESAKFSTFVTNTMAPKAQQIYENSKNLVQESTSLDSEQARQVADTPVSETETKVEKPTFKIDPTKFDKVSDKMNNINKIVDIKPEELSTTTFKEVNDKFAGKVASEIFNVPEAKITDPTKNLTYAKKITNGIPENSEAGNIQDFIRVGQNAEKFIKILPEENVSSETADINALGENIDVSRDVLGRGLGLNNRMLNYFYNKTNRRSRGKTSQPTIWELKSEFKNPSAETIAKFKEDIGITPQGQLNKYDRNIGQILKGIAKLQGQNVANLVARNKVDQIDVKTAKPKKQVKADIKSGTSRIMLSAKEDAGKTRFNDKVSENIKISRIDDAKKSGYTPGKKYTDVPKLMYNRNKKLPKNVRSFEGETIIQGMSRITNNFLARYPQYEQFLNKALTFGVDRSPFGVQELWNKNVTKRGSQDQASFKKPNYTDGKKIRSSWYQSTKKPDYVKNELKKLDDLIQFYKDFETYSKDNKKDLWFLDELAVAAQNAQASPLRANAPTLILEREPGTKKPLMGVKGVEEHTQPQNEAISILTGGVNNNTLDQAEKIVRATYMQGFLSLANNDLLDVDFKSTMPDILYKAIDNGLELDPGLLSTIRLSEAGIDLSNIEYIPTGQTLAEYFFNDNNMDVKTQKQLMRDLFEGKSTLKQLREYGTENSKVTADKPKVFRKNSNKTTTKFSKSNNNEKLLNDLNSHDKALANSKNLDAPVKGISVFDFDDTVATSKSMVIVKLQAKPDKEILDIGARRLFGDTALKDVPGFLKTFDNLSSEQQIKVLETIPGNIERITPAEFAKRHSELEQQGAEFDFSEFNKVVEGKPGPLAAKLQKAIDKFGNKDVFILTARPQESAGAIYEFLKGIGLEIPLKNITGLADGTPQAKANWMIGKAAEGYNDFYFADDVYKNVKAVQDALEVLDVKSKSRLAYADRIKKLDRDFNDILEAKTGIGAEKVYSKAKATVVGASKGKFKFFIPPSAEDFVGLLYNTLAKGKLGDNQMAWYKKNLLDPYAKAMHAISRERIALTNDYKALKKQLKIVPKNLRKKISGDVFTNEQAVRVYIWNKQGMDIPLLSKSDTKNLVDYIESRPDLKVFADQLINIHKGDGYTAPNSGWLAGTITTDIQIGLGTTKRAKHLAEWQQNVDIIFSEKNLNKMEAAFGKAHREALEGMLQRMKTGRNRSFQQDSLTGKVTDWLTNSIGTIMFFNTRSAILQTISSVNFINFGDNNIFKAGKAFANQPQYWSDFMKLMNSDFLVDRRRGLRINVNENDIANMARESGPRGVISKMLELGFLPTQIADSFAIASGGATFYRNRINSLKKQGMSTQEAEAQAMRDFREIAEESQQSSRPDRISAQQAGPLGRVILAFANTPMQYARLIKKAASDLINRRGDWKTNVSKLVYYSTVQNLIFNALQQAIFAIAFGDIEEEDENEKYQNIANGMLDSLLRGIGIAGAFTSVGKNAIIRIIRESEKDNPKYEKVGYELTKISPPVSSKLSRINQAARAFQWEKKEMREKGFAIDNPALLAGANVISATTNIPVDRLVKKTNNVVNATNDELETWQRLALLSGWQDWELNIEKPKKKKKKAPLSNSRKINKSKGLKNVRKIE